MKQSQQFLLVAALSSLTSGSSAFSPPSAARTNAGTRPRSAFSCHSSALMATKPQLRRYPVTGEGSSRLCSYYGDDNNDQTKEEEKGFLEKIKDTAKSFLPRNWGKSKSQIQRSEKIRKDVKGGLSEIVKDAPLPVRMMAGMIGPLVSNLASGLAETMSEQAQKMEELLEDAQRYIVRDSAAAQALGGEPISVSSPLSQSSSTSNINGKVSSRVQASFPVSGLYASGTATMIASEEGITSLSLNVGGRMYNINVSGRAPPSSTDKWSGPSSSGLGKNRINKDDIIDVEFVEKK